MRKYNVIFLTDPKDKSKVLLLKRASNQPFAPNKYTRRGGLVDDGESIIDSANRELQEKRES